jgi:IgGFc binding protein
MACRRSGVRSPSAPPNFTFVQKAHPSRWAFCFGARPLQPSQRHGILRYPGSVNRRPESALAALLALLSACSGEGRPPQAVGRPIDPCADAGQAVLCEDAVAYTCRDGRTLGADDCASSGGVCVPAEGCLACRPFAASCSEGVLYRCALDGSGLVPEQTCEAPEVCTPSGCRDLCGEARANRSYLGCTYFPALPINSELDPSFRPAVVVGNPSPVAAHVVLTRGGELLHEADVAPADALAIPLAYDPALGQRGRSVLARGAAYELRADVPVTVQQWSPLEFSGQCSTDDGGSDGCGSVTNDASLLLPAEALARDEGELVYLVGTRPTFTLRDESGLVDGRSGFVLVVGASDTPAHVTVRTTAHLAPSGPEGEPIAPLAPGDTLRATLARGDVLQLLSAPDAPCAAAALPIQNGLSTCLPADGYDLSGSEIRSDAPVAVIAGHDCSNVPIDRPACDHLEESLLPVDTWGKRVYATRPIARRTQPFLVQVLSGADDNTVELVPGDGGPITLARGESYVFESTRELAVQGSAPLAVITYMEGQGGGRLLGDPSMTVAAPVEQWRSEYVFLTPATYVRSYATVTAAPGTELVLDGRSLDATFADDALGMGAYTAVLERPGAHTLRSASGAPFGLQLAGIADYTSYLCPGGLDLEVEPPPL